MLSCRDPSVLRTGLLVLATLVASTSGVLSAETVYTCEDGERIQALEIRDGKVLVYCVSQYDTQEPEVCLRGEGEERTLEKGEVVVTSPNLQHVGKVSLTKATDGKEGVVFKLLEDKDEVWTSEELAGRWTFQIANEGQRVLAVQRGDIDAPSGTLRLFELDSGGPSPPGKWSRQLDAIRGVQLSRDGSRVLVDTGRGGLLLLDHKLNDLYPLPACEASGLSGDGEKTVELHRDAVVVYEGQSEICRFHFAEPPRRMDLCADGTTLAVISARFLRVYDLCSRTCLWETTAPPGGRFQNVALDEGGRKIAAGVLFVERIPTRTQTGKARARVRLIARDRTSIFDKDFDPVDWNYLTPKLKFVAGDKEWVVACSTKVTQRFEVPQ
jgi:hypothetical protein